MSLSAIVAQRVEAHVDLGLARGADLVVLHLDRDADLLERQQHLGAEVLVLVHRRDREVPLLVADLVPEVRGAVELGLAPGVPHALDRVEEVVARVLVLVEARRVEDVELGFGPEVRGVGDAGAREVVLGLLRDVARVAAVGLAGDRVLHEAVDVQRLVLRERVDHRGVGIGDQEHVRLLDLLEAADRRAVEAEAVLEDVLGQLVGRDREVLHEPGQVAEADVDDVDALVREHASGRHWESPRLTAFLGDDGSGPGRLLPTHESVGNEPGPCRVLASSYVSERAADRVGDQPGHDVRVHVGVRATVLDVALLVDLDLPRDAHRRAAVGDAVAELRPRRGLVAAGEAVLDAGAVVGDVLRGASSRAPRTRR